MATPEIGDGDRRNASLSELIRSLLSDASLIFRREGELAMIEIKAKASKVGVGLGLLAGGVLFAMFALATLVGAAVLALAIVLPAWAAALVVAAVLVVAAAVLVLIGRARLRKATPLAPTRALQAAKEDIGWIQRETEHLRISE